jgi:CzcA family heavy metal efflux pump
VQFIVLLALKRPYTFVVMSILIAFLGVFVCFRTPKDVFPSIDIPVISVVWTYTGMSPDDMEKRIVTVCESAMTTTVNDIEHLESQSLYGVGVVKVFFHPGVDIAAAEAQVTSIVQTVIKQFPQGTTAPLVLQYSASSVPIIQLGLESETLTEEQLSDFGTQFIRNELATVQGASIPYPYGGKTRQVQVDLEPEALMANGLSPLDVSNAISSQNLVLPSGTVKFGSTEYQVRLNSSPANVSAINDMPIKLQDRANVYIRDVATVHDGSPPQTNAVTINGHPAALMTVRKSGDSSTLDVVDRIRAKMPFLRASLPKELNVKLLFDQSLFVRASIYGVIREAVIAAALTAAMILLFLGSWRSTVVVCTTIPLAIFASICCLGLLGETLNIMTLGGLALAVGILVDDATVEIENIHRNLGMGKGLRRSILDGAAQIATPTLVSTLSICIVFVSVVFLTGPAKYLFTPMAMAVVFAMLASYLLSRTVIPNLVRSLLQKELHMYHAEADHASGGWVWNMHHHFNHHFERFRASYGRLLQRALDHRKVTICAFCCLFLVSFCLIPFVGEDFFPSVDAGQFRLHVRVPSGTRLEETLKRFHQVEDSIRKIIPNDEIDLVVDNVGITKSGMNLSFSDGSVAGPSDGEILVSLKPEHGPTAHYVERMRKELPKLYPDSVFFFQPGDIVSQILNFGLPTPIDIQVVGHQREKNLTVARAILRDVALVPGAVDVHLHQIVDEPTLDIDVDRARAQQMGLHQSDVANQLLVSLSGSGQASPNFWLDPKNGFSYLVAVQTPDYKIDSMEALLNTPIKGTGADTGAVRDELLSNLVTVKRGLMQANINHYNVQPVFDVYANVQNRDLGGVSADIEKILARYRKDLPRGTRLAMRGQVQSMRESFRGLGMGIVFAVILVYLLMVVNFQSWTDPLIIIMALPGALSGIVWMLFITQTTFNVPSLMGTIMCVGVAVANSILMVTFANERQDDEGDNSMEAAWAAGSTRLRPVLMTALAMIIGMVPMALAMGEGGEQNAPLGRAVIGGLLVATFTTLFLVPVMYTLMRTKPKGELDPPDPEDG